MAVRIIEMVCPHCKNGIKHDTLTSTTTAIEISEYPEVNEAGRCWCKTCQHGTYPNEDGLCMECADKGRATRLQPKKVKEVKEEKFEKVEVVDNIITLDKTAPQQKATKPTKKVIGKVDKKSPEPSSKAL